MEKKMQGLERFKLLKSPFNLSAVTVFLERCVMHMILQTTQVQWLKIFIWHVFSLENTGKGAQCNRKTQCEWTLRLLDNVSLL